MSDSIDRRTFSLHAITLAAGSAALLAGARAADALEPLAAPPLDGLTKTAEAIHEEILIPATRASVYEVLTDAKRFSSMTTFSTVPKAKPAEVARVAGGAFSLFDGHITGRQVELVPNRRVVQAWRAADWPAGAYSMVRFELTGDGTQTTIVLDHTGFPAGQGEHLVQGWELNYWAPLKKLLG
jgi:activator of HSP90 ATPase